MAKTIYTLSLWVIIIGFFLPFINTCDRKTTVDENGETIEIRDYSLAKPDGINHSGIGYMIEYGIQGKGLFFVLMAALLVASYLLIKTALLKLKIIIADICFLSMASLFFLWLLYEDQLINLQYGALVITAGYLSALVSAIFIYRRRKIS